MRRSQEHPDASRAHRPRSRRLPVDVAVRFPLPPPRKFPARCFVVRDFVRRVPPRELLLPLRHSSSAAAALFPHSLGVRPRSVVGRGESRYARHRSVVAPPPPPLTCLSLTIDLFQFRAPRGEPE